MNAPLVVLRLESASEGFATVPPETTGGPVGALPRAPRLEMCGVDASDDAPRDDCRDIIAELFIELL